MNDIPGQLDKIMANQIVFGVFLYGFQQILVIVANPLSDNIVLQINDVSVVRDQAQPNNRTL